MSHENTLRGRIRSVTRNLFICLVATAVLLLVLPAHAAPPTANYVLALRGGNPAIYANVPPSVLPCPAGGRAASPLTGANYPEGVESLAPGILGLGQIVPFEVKVSDPGDEDILVNLKFEDANGSFGFDPSYGVYCVFVDTADPDTMPGGNEKASIVSTTINPDEIDGTIKIEGLAAGKSVVVQIWMVLDGSVPPDASGTVQSRIESAQTVSGTKINAGTQTCPMSKITEFVSKPADISIQKSDAQDPVALFGNITYTIETHNNSATTFANGVVITDTLDANTSFVDVSVNDTTGYPTTCQHAAGVVTCDVGWLDLLETVTVTITATVNKGTPWGPGGDGPCTVESSPVCNQVSVTSINDDVASNNSASQATGVEEYEPFGGLVLNKEADKGVVYAGTLVTYSYEVSNPKDYPVYDVEVKDDKCQPVTFVSGDTDGDSQLDPDEIWVFTCESTLSEDTTNKGTVTGTDWMTDLPLETSNTAFVDVINPEIVLEKTSEAPTITTGGTANYTYVVTNIGDDPIQDVTVDDDKCSPVVLAGGDANGNSLLDPSELWTFTCSQALSDDTTNTAQAKGKDSLTNIVRSNTSTVTVKVDKCYNVDVTVDRAAIDIGPEQLAVYGRAAFKKLVKNTRRVDKELSKRLTRSGKRLEPKMQIQIKLANQQLDQLPNIIRVCPSSTVCTSVDNTQKLIQYQNAVRKLSGIVLRTLNRGTRLAAKSVKNIQRKTRPFGTGVKKTTKDLLGKAATIPPVQSFCWR